MNREVADKIYNERWNAPFISYHDLFERIRTLSFNGAYGMCIYIDSVSTYDEVFGSLVELGYSVEHYNGGNNGVIEISWG